MVLYKVNNNLSLKVNIINEKNVPIKSANKRLCLILLLTIEEFLSPWNLLISGNSDVEMAAIKNPGIVKSAKE